LWVYREKLARGEAITADWLARKLWDKADPPEQRADKAPTGSPQERRLEEYAWLLDELGDFTREHGPNYVIGLVGSLLLRREEVTAKAVRDFHAARERRRDEETASYVRQLRAYAVACKRPAATAFADYLEDKSASAPPKAWTSKAEEYFRRWLRGRVEERAA